MFLLLFQCWSLDLFNADVLKHSFSQLIKTLKVKNIFIDRIYDVRSFEYVRSSSFFSNGLEIHILIQDQ
jgi:hypothetical protein